MDRKKGGPGDLYFQEKSPMGQSKESIGDLYHGRQNTTEIQCPGEGLIGPTNLLRLHITPSVYVIYF